MGVEKRRAARGEKNIIFRRGEGINIVSGPKYRPLHFSKQNERICMCSYQDNGLLSQSSSIYCFSAKDIL
jgi:hypothetical protein